MMKFGAGEERGGPMKDRKSEGFGEDCAVPVISNVLTKVRK